MSGYTFSKIAEELQATAMGRAYHGNALRLAREIHFVTPDDVSLLERWLTGSNTMDDFWALQDLNNRIAAHES